MATTSRQAEQWPAAGRRRHLRPGAILTWLALTALAWLAINLLPEGSGQRQVLEQPKGVFVARPGSNASDIPIVVNVYEFGFQPSRVVIKAGQAVAWRDVGDDLHTITPATKAGEKVFLKAERLGSFSHVFTQPGVYPYYCAIHRQMHGTITVVRSFSARDLRRAGVPDPLSKPGAG